MPDLDRTPVMDWVAACTPNLLDWCAEPVRAIEDEQDIRPALVDLGNGLDAPAFEGGGLGAALEGTDIARDLQTALTQLGPARLIRLFRWLGLEGGTERAKILHLLLDARHPDAHALRTALDALNKRELLSRIFDNDRLAELLAATNAAPKGADA